MPQMCPKCVKPIAVSPLVNSKLYCQGHPEPETTACETCGAVTRMLGTKRCDNCYEVESRLDKYLQAPNGRTFVNLALNKDANEAPEECPHGNALEQETDAPCGCRGPS